MPRSHGRRRRPSVAVSPARSAGGRTSLQALGSGNWQGLTSCAGGPTASCTTLRLDTSTVSAALADHTGQCAIAVTPTMTTMAQPAVVIVALISDWRERHRRYRPTI